MAQAKEQWGSRMGVILAVAGSAVGLGNFLRFPGLAAQYGGGAFMIAYFVSLLLLGLPVCWAEWTMGRMGGGLGFNSSPTILAAITRRPWLRFFGVVAVIVPVILYMYYVLVESWCLAYAWNYLFGEMRFVRPDGTPDSAAIGSFFKEMVGIKANGAAMAFDARHAGWFFLAVFALNFFLIYRGVSKGIEWFCSVAVPMLVVLGLVVLLRVLTLGTPDAAHPERNINNGLGFMWNPDKVLLEQQNASGAWVTTEQLLSPAAIATAKEKALADPSLRVREVSLGEQLSKPGLWLAAAGQIFFTLSLGMGVIINYASYLRRNDDIVLSGLTATAANEFCEVGIGGLMTIPACVAFLGTAGVIGSLGSTFAMGFNVLPMVFTQMPAGMLFGFCFFFLLFLAAITSSISMIQPGIAYLEEAMHITRKQSVAVLGVVTALGCGFVFYFSAGLQALDTLDFWVTNLLMILLALGQILIFGWLIGPERALKESHRGAALKIPRALGFVARYLTPLFLIVIFLSWFYQDVLGYSLSTPGVRVYSHYVKDLFIEHDVVAWMSVSLIALMVLFVILLLPSRKRFEAVAQHTGGSRHE